MRNLPAGFGILSLLAAVTGLSGAAGIPAVAGPGENAPPFFVSANLSLTLGESLAICDGEFAFVHRSPEPGLVRIPLPAGQLASQESATLAGICLARGEAANTAPAGLIQLPTPGHHRLRFQLHLPARLDKEFRTITIPPAGAPVCGLRIRTEPGWLLDERSTPPGFWDGNTWIAAFPPSSKPLTLRWQAVRSACNSGIGVQQSRFAYTLRDGELRGRLEIRGTFAAPAELKSLRCGIPAGCVITSVVSPAVKTWRIHRQELTLYLKSDAPRDLDLTLLTVSPIPSPNATLALALPRLDAARTVQGTLDLTNAGPHSIGGCELPAGFVAQTQGPPSKNAAKTRGPDLSYRFFALQSGATGSLSLFQPQPRIRSTVTARLTLDEQEAEIVREIRLSAETAPIYSADVHLPADESTDSVRLVEGDAKIRCTLAGKINLTWNAGLAPGRSALLAVVTRKSLAWNQGTALFRLESPSLPGEWLSGKLILLAAPSLSIRPVRNPRLCPVPAAELPGTACAAWNHRDFDALLVEVGMRQAQRTATLDSRVWPSSQGGRMAGELRIDPGGLPLGEVKLLVEGGDSRLLRLRSERVSETHRDAEAGTVSAIFDPPQSVPFTLPWDMAVPAQALPTEGASRRTRLVPPLLRILGLPLQAHRVTVFGAPFCSVELTLEGLESLPASPQSKRDSPVAELIAASPEPNLQITCQETGLPVDPPWEIEELKLASQVAAFAPHRHRCHIVLLPTAVPRNFPLILPPQTTVLSASLQGRRVVPLESTAHPGEVLIPLPGGSTRLNLELDYLTEGVPWAGTGEATLIPPLVPGPALTRKCGWTAHLPLEFEYSDFATNLSSLDPPAILPITLQPLRSLILNGDRLRRQFALATPVSTRRYHGNFTPAPISFRYIHQRRQLWTALLWVLGGITAFAVFARERPLYHGLFGVLLLTFLPSSGLASPRIFSDGLLLGWLVGGAVLASRRLIRKHRRQLPKPAAGLATVFLVVLGGCPHHAKSAGLESPLFVQSTHEIQIKPEALHVTSTYLTTATLPDRNILPTILRLKQFDSLTVEGIPFDFDQEDPGLPDSRPQTIVATYRLPLSSRPTWKVAPAASSLAIVSGLSGNRLLTVNGGMPLTRHAPGAVAAALGSATQIRLRLASAPPNPPLPAKAQIRAALGLFPATKRLACDVTFEHLGHTLDRFTLDVPREFHLTHLTGSQTCHAVETATEPERLQLEVRFSSARRDRTSFRLEWEAPFSPAQSSVRCLLPQPRAGICETSLTLAVAPPLAGSLRSVSPLPVDKTFLPSDWADAAKVATAVRLPDPHTPVWADVRCPSEQGDFHLNRQPVPLTAPVRVRASFDATTAPGQTPPRIVPAPLVFDSDAVLAVSVAPEGCASLEIQIAATPLESSLDSLSVLLPGRFPAIRWSADHLREARAESTSGSDVYTLVFTGPDHRPVSCTGSARLSVAAAGLRLPFPTVAGATHQRRYLVLPPAGSSPWQFQLEGAKEIALGELPGRRSWPSGARAFAVTAESPSLAISREPPTPVQPRDLPNVLDLSLATTLRKNGDSSHRAQAWITPPAEDTLEVELPAASVLSRVRLNGEPAAIRSLSAPGTPPGTFALALPPDLSRDAPLLLELEYDTLPEKPAFQNARRLEYQLGAPRLGNLPVVQTAWQFDALQARTLRPGEGNLYTLEASDFAVDRAQSLVSLARELKRTLERGNPSLAQQSALRSRILTLTGDAALTGQNHGLQSERDEARRLREYAARGPNGAHLASAVSREAFIPLPAKSSACFKKLRGDAHLHLAALPESDPGILKSWLWFGAALAALAGWDRFFGTKAVRSSSGRAP